MDDVSIERYVRLTKLAKALAQSEELAFGDALAVIHTVEQADAGGMRVGGLLVKSLRVANRRAGCFGHPTPPPIAADAAKA